MLSLRLNGAQAPLLPDGLLSMVRGVQGSVLATGGRFQEASCGASAVEHMVNSLFVAYAKPVQEGHSQTPLLLD